MEKLSTVMLVFLSATLAPIVVHTAKADPEPTRSDSATADPNDDASSSADTWSRLSPEAYRAARDQEEEPLNERAQRREARARPDWLVLDHPRSVTRVDEDRVHRAGILLAAGIPATLAGAMAMGFSAGNECSEGFFGAGAFLTTVGVGLDLGGVIALARTSKEARRARRTGKHRARMSGAAVGSALASTVIVMGPGIAKFIGCD